MAARALCLFCVVPALAAGGPQTCGAGTSTHPTSDDPILGCAMLQSAGKQGRLAASGLAARKLDEEEVVLTLAASVEDWHAQARSCGNCTKGCLRGVSCDDGVQATKADCHRYNGTWCHSVPNCNACPDGCIVQGQCHYQTPQGNNVYEAVCRTHLGQWCGAVALSCFSCEDGCLANGHCYYRIPTGENATEQLCAFHGGKWCGPTVA
mmetsp:Transcript_74406/g.197649  ORF Transcript_74406/g.197649 Transcript_74406/m.197649 type:complete len:208 (-) Transcript_74406:138-761(-)